MRYALMLVALVGCTADLVGPEDGRCTIYVGENEVAHITRWQIEHCETVRIIVVRFE